MRAGRILTAQACGMRQDARDTARESEGESESPPGRQDPAGGQAAVRNGWGGSLGERDAVYCIPERLWCYPRAPAVQDLEQFVFPKQVLVRQERHREWHGMTRPDLRCAYVCQ